MPTVTTYAQTFSLDAAFFARLTNAELYSTNGTSRTYQGPNGHDLVTVTGSGFGALDVHGYPTTGVITGLEIWWEDEAHVVLITGLSLSASAFFGPMGNTGAWSSFVTAAFAGADTLNGGPANDDLYGGGGADTLSGGLGADALHGDAGDDTLSGGPGNDILDGGAGIDAASFAGPSAVTVDLNAGAATIFDGTGANTDTLIAIETVIGSDGADVLYGRGVWTGNLLGEVNDNLYGGAGDDVIDGGLGTDVLDGGAGTDTAAFGRAHGGVTVSLAVAGPQDTGGANTKTLAGFENLTGSGGDDTLTGDAGANTLAGGAGVDHLYGGGGDDILSGGAHNDVLDGGAGFDIASYAGIGGALGVTVSLAITTAQNTGADGTDTLTGIEGLVGTASNDVLTGDAGDNRLYGGSGDDILAGGAGADLLDGAAGLDTASYADITGGGVTVDLSLTTAQNTGAGGMDTLTGIENLTGSDGADTLKGDGGANVLRGGAANDALWGQGGDDVLYGGGGFDSLIGGDGADILFGGADGNYFYGGAGDDILYGGYFDENGVRFSSYGSSFLYGGAGANTLYGGAGPLSYAIASYSTAVTVDLAAGTATGAGFSDTLIGIVQAAGSDFADSLTGNGAANSLWGGSGDDILTAAGGDDFMMGEDGADILYGGAGQDVLDGGFGPWADTLYGGGGRDTARYLDTASSGATWTHNADGTWTVTDGSAGADTLSGVEVLKFSDRLVVIAQDAPSDFNNDGKSDVLWRNDNGEIYVWNSQGGQGAFLGQSLGNPGTGWHVQDVGDYDGDHKADILWRNNAGDIYVYRSDDGAPVTFTGQSISYVDPVWAIVPHAGDFNGDGKSEILFRNTATGEVYLWDSTANDADPDSFDPVQFIGQSLGVVASSWQIQGVDDFNADGRADILWRNTAGDVYLWLATGSSFSVGVTGQTVSSVGNDWTILGTGDFNGDGRADILWRHAGDGELYVWNSQPGLTAVNFLGQSVGLVGLDWSVAAIGDYDGDGRSDVLFRNADGRVYVWNSNDSGPVAFQGQGLGQTPTDWHILSDFHGM
jgi:Ca2+-binding RTX toxin-like protein